MDWLWIGAAFGPSDSVVVLTAQNYGDLEPPLKIWPNGGRLSKTFYWQLFGSCDWAFDWRIFRLDNSPITPYHVVHTAGL